MNYFNANDFSKVFWADVSLMLIIISLVRSRNIASIPKRIIYVLTSVVLSLALGLAFLSASPYAK